MKAIALVVVLALGCGKSKQECKAQADDLVKLLRATDQGGEPIRIDEDMHLVPRPELPHIQFVAGPVVVIKAGRIEYQGQLIGDAAELRERLDAMFEKRAEEVRLGMVPPRAALDNRAYFEIDAAAKWGTIASAVDVAGEVGFVPHFLFALPVKVQRPPRAPVDDELDRMRHGDPGNNAARIAQLVSKQVESCPAIKKVFGAVASEEGGDKAQIILDGMGPALVDCNCDVDLPNLRSTMYAVLATEHPTADLPVTVARDGTPLELPVSTSWADAAGKLPASGKVWLVAK